MATHRLITLLSALMFFALSQAAPAAESAVLDKDELLARQTFWDNRDWDWYKQNIPFFECPDTELNTTYYYRWELITKHLTYGSPNSGYSFTEFIDRPFWSGAYGATLTEFPPAKINARPRTPISVASVAMNGGTRILAMSQPFISPIRIPASTEITKAARKPCSLIRAASTLASATVAPTERSMRPLLGQARAPQNPGLQIVSTMRRSPLFS